MTQPSAIEQAARAVRNGDLDIQFKLTETYARALTDVTNAERALARDIARRQAAGEVIKPTWLNQQQRYLSLQSQYYQALQSFGLSSYGLIVAGVNGDVARLLEATPQEVRAQGIEGPGYDSRTWSVINKEAFAAAQGILDHDSSPLRQILERDLPETGVAAFRKEWTRGLLLGHNPNKIARTVAKKISTLSLGRAQLIARTEFHRAYRAGKQEQFQRSQVIDSWTWRAALDRRTCGVCWGMHGTVHPTSEPMESHPACRCVMVPVTDSPHHIELEEGEARFSRLPADEQLRILGPSRFKAYNRGASLASMIGTRPSAQWGTIRSFEPLRAVRTTTRAPGGSTPGAARSATPTELSRMSADQYATYLQNRYGLVLDGSLSIIQRQVVADALESYLAKGIDIRTMTSVGKVQNTGRADLGPHPLQAGGTVPAHYDTRLNTVVLSEAGLRLLGRTRGYGIYDGHDGFKALMQHEVGHAVHHGLSAELKARWASIYNGTNSAVTMRAVTKALNSAIQRRADAKRKITLWQSRIGDPAYTGGEAFVLKQYNTYVELDRRYSAQIDALRDVKKHARPNEDVHPSKYGENNQYEDFAETMWRWLNTPEWLATNAPSRYAFFKEVFG